MFQLTDIRLLNNIEIWKSKITENWVNGDATSPPYIEKINYKDDSLGKNIFQTKNIKVPIESVDYNTFYNIDTKLYNNDYNNIINLLRNTKISYFNFGSDFEKIYLIENESLVVRNYNEIFPLENRNFNKEYIQYTLRVKDIRYFYEYFGTQLEFLLNHISNLYLYINVSELITNENKVVNLFTIDENLISNPFKKREIHVKLFKIKDNSCLKNIVDYNNDFLINLNKTHYLIKNGYKNIDESFFPVEQVSFYHFIRDLLLEIEFYKEIPMIKLITCLEDFGISYTNIKKNSKLEDELSKNNITQLRKLLDLSSPLNNIILDIEKNEITKKNLIFISLNFYFYEIINRNPSLNFLNNIYFEVDENEGFYTYEIKLFNEDVNKNFKVLKFKDDILFLIHLMLFKLNFINTNPKNILYIDETFFKFNNILVNSISNEIEFTSKILNIFTVINSNNFLFNNLKSNTSKLSEFPSEYNGFSFPIVEKNIYNRMFNLIDHILLIKIDFEYEYLSCYLSDYLSRYNENYRLLIINVSDDDYNKFIEYFSLKKNNILILYIDTSSSYNFQVSIRNADDIFIYKQDLLNLIPKSFLEKSYNDLYGKKSIFKKLKDYINVSIALKYWKFLTNDKNEYSNRLRQFKYDCFKPFENESTQDSYLKKYFMKTITYQTPVINSIEINKEFVNNNSSGINERILHKYDKQYNIQKYKDYLNINIIEDFEYIFNVKFNSQNDFICNSNFIGLDDNFDYDKYILKCLMNVNEDKLVLNNFSDEVKKMFKCVYDNINSN